MKIAVETNYTANLKNNNLNNNAYNLCPLNVFHFLKYINLIINGWAEEEMMYFFLR